ncbi:MAG: 50S ribosomal protein L7Ae-like protein [Armatimonadetes bacterium]|nr:50S ribosomal protein L7Ae-like protein [Armatimonadota bacterium]
MTLDELRAAPRRAVGSNQTTKAVRRGMATVVFVARDSDRRLVATILEAARAAGVPVIESESGREIGRACGIAVGAIAAAVLKAS